jgi:hypothetical protein
LGKEGADIHRKSILDTVYSVDSEYDRTMGLLNSVDYNVTKKGDVITIRIFNNEGLMSNYTTHESWVDGSNQNSNIVNYLNNGHHGIVDYTPANFVGFTEKELEKIANSFIRKELRKMGHKVK